MSCQNCQNRCCTCDCPEADVQKTQQVVGNHVLLSTLVVCASHELDSDVDVVDVVAAGVTITLPNDPIPLKSYRIVASGGDVTVIAFDECCNALPIADNVVPAGTSRDFTFSEALGRWVPACCGDDGGITPDLATLIGPQGLAGLVGAIGAQGVAGLVGAIGPIGVAGLVGLIGPQGVAGLVGEQGIAGVAGLVGEQGVAGVAGELGLTGPAGPEGPAGPAGGLGGEYAYVYNNSLETVAVEDAVDFDSNGLISPGISHAPGSSVINIAVAGVYEVTWTASGVEPNQFALFLNGAPVIESTFGSGAGTQPNVGQVLLTIPAGSTLTLVNHSSAADVILQENAGGTQAAVNASVLIRQIA